MTYLEIELNIDNGVATIFLARPDKLNAYTPDMGEELVHAIREAAADEAVQALIITGKGAAFCAGADREFLAGKRSRSGKKLGEEEFITSFTEEFSTLPILTIAAFNGAAVGIGITAMLSADIRIAVEDAALVLNFAELGIMPGLGSTYFLPHLVGQARARELLMCERRLDGRSAERYGLINKAVPADQLMDAALELARSAGECKPGMIKVIKQGLTVGGSSTLAQALACEKKLSTEVRR